MAKVKYVRSKNLRNFLKIYFYAYIKTNPNTSPLYSKTAMKYREKHPPRVFPGLATIQQFLQCEKSTAQDYLRAIQITREIFVTKDQKQEAFKYIQERKQLQLLKDLSPRFEKISKAIFLNTPQKSISRIKLETRKILHEVAELISEQVGVFAPNECAQIVRELADWFV